MITYKELSTLTYDLGISAKTLYSVSNNIQNHYNKCKIPKRSGGVRVLTVPDNLLKCIQHKIVSTLLVHEEISPYAKAYRFGGSILKNAAPHLGQSVVVKLDIKDFFDHIIYSIVKEKAFPKERYSEANRVLLTLLCIYKDSLPQGAPTSPFISNIIMREFDDVVGKECKRLNINYTRYCDDMTFSGDFEPEIIIETVKKELRKIGFFLNDKKTLVLRNGQKKVVTGVVVNEKLNISADYRKKLRQELYYCRKYGIHSHLDRVNSVEEPGKYLQKTLGKVNYILSIDRENREMLEYKKWLIDQMNMI